MTLGEILEEFEDLDRCNVYYDRRWDQIRESTNGSLDYVRYDELSELVHKFRTNLEMADEAVVCVPKDRYAELVQSARELQALEAAGVDNWEGCDYAQEILAEIEAEEGE